MRYLALGLVLVLAACGENPYLSGDIVLQIGGGSRILD